MAPSMKVVDRVNIRLKHLLAAHKHYAVLISHLQYTEVHAIESTTARKVSHLFTTLDCVAAVTIVMWCDMPQAIHSAVCTFDHA